MAQLRINDPITAVKGVGKVKAEAFARLRINTVADLLRHYPRDYEDRTKTTSVFMAADGEKCCIRAVLGRLGKPARLPGGRLITRASAYDDTGTIDIVFFNRKWLESSLKIGQSYVFYGQVSFYNGRKSLVNPEFEAQVGGFTGRIVPIYPLCEGLSRNDVMKAVSQAMQCAGECESVTPDEYSYRHMLVSMQTAVRDIHFPADMQAAAAARRRLIFDELLTFSTAINMVGQTSEKRGIRMSPRSESEFEKLLPFSFTGAQRRAVNDAFSDMCSGKRMNRLIQGDVGSGKTAAAMACCWLAAENGYQSAVMAPTEILARQHTENFKKILEPMGIKCELLVSSLPAAEKNRVKKAAASGEASVVIGTQALLQSDLVFQNAGLFVVDEQHRFGVAQRGTLSDKGFNPHVLVMSATPIPRTLTLIIYGELDVSVIDELPPGRQQILTYQADPSMESRVWDFARKQINDGGQVYVVCPLIEESDDPDGKAAATEMRDMLARDVFPDLTVGLLHGRMKTAEKESVMADFASGKTDILVCTTVIEVGVDVPNATLMIIQNADMFGLSQLHQLRGRVGRGSRQSYCVLKNAGGGEIARRRLRIICKTSDGFKIAEEDLKLRGPGDFIGRRQHGLPQFRIADLTQDVELMRDAAAAASEITKKDPLLQLPQHAVLRERAVKMLENAEGTMN